MKPFTEIQTIVELAVEQNASFDTFGFRVITEMPCGNIEVVTVGHELQDSFEWVDGETTSESLGGTSVISFDVDTFDGEINEKSYNKALGLMSQYIGGQLVIVAGRNVVDAIVNDEGESVLSGAAVIAIM